MFMTKKKKVYTAFTKLTDYVGPTSFALHSQLFAHEDAPGLVCSSAVVLVYLQILAGGSSALTDMYLLYLQDQPEIQRQLCDAVNTILDYFDSPAAKNYYSSIDFPDKVSRLVSDPANILLDRKYGMLIYSAQRIADDYYAEYNDRISLDHIPIIYHRFFISQERTAIPLVQSIQQLLQ